MRSPKWEVIHGDCLDVMPRLDADSVDSIVTDPPYGLAFMGKSWDHGVPGVPFWSEALRVAKPGAHLLAFGGTRTFHRLTCAIEDAGWEIRDCLSYLYGSGFPKSHNGAWGGTALKPAWEPIILARKSLIGTVAANHAAHGTGALNIDGCRIACDDKAAFPVGDYGPRGIYGADGERTDDKAKSGRWPANVLLDEEAAEVLDEQVGDRRSAYPGNQEAADAYAGSPVDVSRVVVANAPGTIAGESYSDFGGASRFFYTAKASRGEREAGLTGRAKQAPAVESAHSVVCLKCNRQRVNVSGACECSEPEWGRVTQKAVANTHPTVKPVDLMRYLVRLITPVGGTVLDPFLGSGTTGVAALEESCRFIGIEREAEYVAIARARIEAAARAPMLDFTEAK